jgi:hypothetical protein
MQEVSGSIPLTSTNTSIPDFSLFFRSSLSPHIAITTTP